MRRHGEFASAILVAAFLGLASQPAAAQVELPHLSPMPMPAQPPVKPYPAVAVVLPSPFDDASFAAFRQQLGDAARRRDRAALGRMVVSRGFFWEREDGEAADKAKSSLANLITAMGLDLPDNDDSGWDTMAIYTEDPTAAAMTDRPGVVCGPADPDFDEQALAKVIEGTQTEVSGWVYTVTDKVEIRAAPRPNAAVVERLGLVFVRVLPDDSEPGQGDAASDYVKVATPSGKTGYVATREIASLVVSQLCYVKEGGAWKVAGVIGGVEP